MNAHRIATIGLALIAIAVGVAAPTLAQSRQPTAPNAPGTVVWFDLLTDDDEAVLEFYRELFGWEIKAHTDRHWLVVHNGRPIAGISQIRSDGSDTSDPFWLAGIVVDDVDRAVERATALGAEVFVQPADSVGYARYAVISDAAGVPVMLLDPVTTLGGDRGPGSWVWAELWTRDPDAAAAFYGDVVGFDTENTEIGGASYRVLTTDGKIRAGLVTIPNDDIEPAWAPYLLVDDLEEVLTRAPMLGGTVVAQPDRFSSRGKVALLADPTGAVFFVYQRTEEGASK